MRQIIIQRSAASLLAATLAWSASLAHAEKPPANPPTADTTAADLLIARPGGLAATVLGAAVFVVGLPFTLINGSTGQAAQQLVVEPAQYTFTRPLGQDL
ncbi:MAG TPA: hypothetical protein P5284_06065 [Candidatus Contendobacter sp.]|jgi:hypothetical protein|nr:hypothetical protein [Candidatus Contendobacter sp.]HRZ24665.1 hypothetical protein [Candidatus Contendobacter sp.]HRZ52722.1 hypothetical protein [Candidatus Contendobacter sp.]